MLTHIPKVEESSKFNLFTSIWIVPFIALCIAAWLVFQYFYDRGPEIQIIFPKNEGLVAGQSVVKFKNVPIGKVTKIYLDENVDGVIVVVRMFSEQAKPYMTEKAKFWIVKPKVGIGGVSGLDTLLSGTYIDVYSEKGGTFKEKHYGLAQPYYDSTKGVYFHLKSTESKHITVGTPLYYKNIQVGKVEYVYLGLDNKSIDILVFVENRYVYLVHRHSKFWIKNMINIDFTKGNMNIDIAPLNFLLKGGIVFSSTNQDENDSVPSDYIFRLFKSQTEADNKNIGTSKKKNHTFIVVTDESLANLSIGALVRFDGFDVGRVTDIKLSYEKETHHMLGQVILEIDTSVFEDKHETNSSGVANFYTAVEEGLRAKIVALDPITRSLYIDLTFSHNDEKGKMVQFNGYPRLPIVPNGEVGMMDTVSQILTKINQLPLDKLLTSMTEVIESTKQPIAHTDEILVNLKIAVDNLNKMTSKKSFEVLPDELSKALKAMTKTLKDTSKVVKGYDSNSLVKEQLSQTLEILTKTSQEMQAFLRMLNRKPNSLIFGDN